MRRLPIDACRRYGQTNDELFQLVDNQGRFALLSAVCPCGHTWTVLHTAPANLQALRAWMGRGCEPPEGPQAPLRGGPWQTYRFEGVSLTRAGASEAVGASLP